MSQCSIRHGDSLYLYSSYHITVEYVYGTKRNTFTRPHISIKKGWNKTRFRCRTNVKSTHENVRWQHTLSRRYTATHIDSKDSCRSRTHIHTSNTINSQTTYQYVNIAVWACVNVNHCVAIKMLITKYPRARQLFHFSKSTMNCHLVKLNAINIYIRLHGSYVYIV